MPRAITKPTIARGDPQTGTYLMTMEVMTEVPETAKDTQQMGASITDAFQELGATSAILKFSRPSEMYDITAPGPPGRLGLPTLKIYFEI